MIKLLHTADWHLGATLHGYSRRVEQKERVEEMVRIAIDEKVDAFLMAGDWFDKRLPMRQASEIAARIATSLLPLARHRIPTVILAGNHDPPEWFAMLRELLDLAFAHGGTDERMLYLVQDPDILCVAGVQLVCLPYPSREIFAAQRRAREDGAADPIRARNDAVVAGLRQVLTGMLASPRFRPNLPSVLMAHFTMSNARMPGQSDGTATSDLVGDFVFPAAAVPNCFVYGAFGHIHNPQDLHTTRTGALPFPSRYPGSPCRLDLGEAEDVKSVSIVEIGDDHVARVRTVELEQTPMARVALDLEAMEAMERGERENPCLGAYAAVTLTHDGSLPRSSMIARLKKLFPRHIGLTFSGPVYEIRAIEERIGAAHGISGGAEELDAENHVATVRTYLEEVLASMPQKDALLAHAERITEEAERKFYAEETIEEIEGAAALPESEKEADLAPALAGESR